MAHGTARSQSLRQSIEAELAGRFVGALTPRPFVQRPQLPIGIASLDSVTGGGIPIGAVTEFVGTGSSGKTSAAMQVAAGAMRSGRMCAWVDASDSFDPDTGAANGMLLSQLLWVRCGGGETEPASKPARSVLLAEAAIDRSMRVEPGRCGSHPRAEEQGLDRAVHGLFQGEVAAAAAFPGNRQKTGTPGAPNLPLRFPPASQADAATAAAQPGNAQLSPYRRATFHPVPRHEQVASDRQGGRKVRSNQTSSSVSSPGSHQAGAGQSRAERLTRSQTVLPPPDPENRPDIRAVPPADTLDRTARSGAGTGARPQSKPWSRLDQALRAADLLLQGGGFNVLVFDLGSIAPEHVLRIPAATWFRFRAVAEASGMAFLLLSQAPCARSSAGLVLHFKPLHLRLAGGTVVESVTYEAELSRQRFQPEPHAVSNLLPDARLNSSPGTLAAGSSSARMGSSVPRKHPRATWESNPGGLRVAASGAPEPLGTSGKMAGKPSGRKPESTQESTQGDLRRFPAPQQTLREASGNNPANHPAQRSTQPVQAVDPESGLP